jgi:hypothetical protein
MDDNTIPVIITLDRRAAILAGTAKWDNVMVDVDLSDLTSAERLVLADTDALGGSTFDLSSPFGEDDGYPNLGIADIASVKRVLAWWATYQTAKQAEKAERERKEKQDEERLEAEHRQKIEAWLADDNDTSPTPRTDSRNGTLFVPADLREAVNAKTVRLEAEARATKAAYRERIMAKATDEQWERYKAGMLPERELLTLVRNVVFEPVGVMPRFRRIKESEVRAEEDLDAKVIFEVSNEREANAEQFAALRRVARQLEKAGLKADCKLRRHSGGYNNDDPWTVTRYSIMATVDTPLGPVSREYPC